MVFWGLAPFIGESKNVASEGRRTKAGFWPNTDGCDSVSSIANAQRMSIVCLPKTSDAREGLGFALEAGNPFGISRERRRQVPRI